MQSAHRYVGVRMANDILDLFQIHSKLIPAGQPQQNILALSRRVRQQPILPHGFDGDARRSCLRQPGQLLRAFVDAIHHDSVGGTPCRTHNSHSPGEHTSTLSAAAAPYRARKGLLFTEKQIPTPSGKELRSRPIRLRNRMTSK